MPSRYLTTEQRENKNCKRHTCIRCGETFTCKTKCLTHMDNDCPKKNAPTDQWFSETQSNLMNQIRSLPSIRMNGYVKKTKPALWTQLPSALKEAADAQRYVSPTGVQFPYKPRKRIPAKSKEQVRRERLYAPLAKWFKSNHPNCACCDIRRRPLLSRSTQDVHHFAGRLGALLFYFPLFYPVCRECHTFIGDNYTWAVNVGMTAPKGKWNKQWTESVWRASWRGGFTYVAAATEAEAAAQLPAGTPTFKLTLIE